MQPFRVSEELSDAERAALMGGTLQAIYKWSPGAGSALGGGDGTPGVLELFNGLRQETSE